MSTKTKKIEVFCGTDIEDSLFLSNNFYKHMEEIFNKISDFELNGGTMFKTEKARFNGLTDVHSVCMIFYCEISLFDSLLEEIKSTFKLVAPKGVKYVSVKVYENAESESFSIC